MIPRYRIHIDWINEDGECFYHVQRRRFWWWKDLTYRPVRKPQAQAILEKLLREDT